ncbi:hypothetical protein TRFO_16281 [Tritrichomonas foetus]|uniref:Uncharacterized protein n=1 Tax=Tritrichomonas foetus TaxID=1144522 RepID=A0A1J4KRG2_9EUKA|nr:hypothetical protein TRFO_16281 [Tritrichomonas foetus]|eukprot:OHT13520.1 hypothetical protein TRFO_16281 [Tritrichomonas foetus]
METSALKVPLFNFNKNVSFQAITAERSKSHPVVSFNDPSTISFQRSLSKEEKDLETAIMIQKKFSRLSTSSSLSNKMPIKRGRNISIGKPAKGLGLGFPKKGPPIEAIETRDAENDEKIRREFELLEDKIVSLKKVVTFSDKNSITHNDNFNNNTNNITNSNSSTNDNNSGVAISCKNDNNSHNNNSDLSNNQISADRNANNVEIIEFPTCKYKNENTCNNHKSENDENDMSKILLGIQPASDQTNAQPKHNENADKDDDQNRNNKKIEMLIQMEKDIVDDTKAIRESINKLLGERGKCLDNHKQWLEERKKLIVQARLKTRSFEEKRSSSFDEGECNKSEIEGQREKKNRSLLGTKMSIQSAAIAKMSLMKHPVVVSAGQT